MRKWIYLYQTKGPTTMPKEIFPSSYLCDCGHQSHFAESTVREVKEMSLRKTVHLGDDDEKHVIVFKNGSMVDILCPKTVHDGRDPA